MTKQIKFIKIILVFSICFQYSNAQVTIDSLKSELLKINQSYDSAFYLSFDVNIDYSSDTTGKGDFDHSELHGKYTFHRKNALYLLDKIEYMQNEDFAIAVYKDDNFILVGKPRNINVGTFLPYREMLDSFTRQLDSLYSFSIKDSVIDEDDSTELRYMVFTANKVHDAIYERIQLEYEAGSHLMKRLTYFMKENIGEYSVEAVGLDNARKARFTINFNNYRVDKVGPDVFDEAKYIFFRSPSDIEPSENYKGFTIYNNINK